MEKLKDQLDEKLQSLLPLNFIMAEFQGNNDEANNSTEIPDLESVQLQYETSSIHSNKIFDSYLFHRHISRTFDPSACKKIEATKE